MEVSVRLKSALLVVGVGLSVGGCAAMTKRAPKAIQKLNLPPLIKDPEWIKGDCQSELRRKGLLGLCAVVPVARGGRPLPPHEVAEKAIPQAAEQLVETTRQVLLRVIANCKASCGNLPDGPPRLDLVARLTTAAVKLARVNQSWLAADDVLYALVALDASSLVDTVNHQSDLDDVAKQELTNRMREDLSR
jgi:hypothetical protein